MNTYKYVGPIYYFGTVLAKNIEMETNAVSLKKARSNFSYQAKMKFGKHPYSHIDLPGTIVLKETESKQIRMDI